jgi:ABC-type lipoprotein export system ATPase subunit
MIIPNNQNGPKEVDFLPNGSVWQRWEPHIHGPGTVLNDQFKGSDAFEEYLKALENKLPVMKAIGVTDYYSTDVYQTLVEAKKNGRLTECDLLFPNIEMRLNTGTIKGNWVNVHLLVSPESPDHIDELNRFLSNLRFEAFGDKYSCTKSDLIRLGRKSDPNIIEDHIALRTGSVQFKVSREQLMEEYRSSDWAKRNILIAVAGGSDGTSGVRDAADTTLREEIEKMSHIIFASSDSQREFWIGKKSLSPEQIISRYKSLKPCIHGSDAHKPEDVGAPVGDRFTWIKGLATFDSLRQACIDPEGRAFVGTNPPYGATPSQVIRSVEIQNTEWCETPRIRLNPGLVAIIGARGSGKTALAEIIAYGCDATSNDKSTSERDRSFIIRAKNELQNSSVTLNWLSDDREPVSRELDKEFWSSDKYPMARYLSQQFVDELCSSDGVTDKLLKELERIIYSSHDVNQREGTNDFDELLQLRASRPRHTRNSEEISLQEICDRIGQEFEKIKLITETKGLIAAKEAIINQNIADRGKLVTVSGSEQRVHRLSELAAAADIVRNNVRYFSQQEQALHGVQDDVKNVRLNKAPEDLRGMKQKHTQAGLKPTDWEPFLIDFKGDVDKVISDNLDAAQKNVQGWKGVVPIPGIPGTAFIADDADLNRQPLALLEAEISRLTALVSADSTIAKRFTAISQKIAQEQAALTNLKEKLADYEEARTRVTELQTDRNDSYGRVFESLLQEEAILRELYLPIMTKISVASGTLNKMSFKIKRTVDVERWAESGERLFDLRKESSFKGKGTLKSLAEESLLQAWTEGTVNDILAAMKKFQDDHANSLMDLATVARTDKDNFRTWAKQFAKWLYSTNHIHITYGVEYDGVDIKKLSPGTRGIVLLLLYLALDDEDDRPLIIDQPEENLDPKSIYDELVGLFIAAKLKRQVIMVTHNANLVINTDADQIIIASTGERLPSGMPKISYMSGGLEEDHIRKEVCGILEGGETAFQRRAHRLRVSLP